MAAPGWLVRNYGPRCTLVCAASVLQRLGAHSPTLVDTIAAATGFRESYGPPVVAYLGGHSALDRGIERAAAEGGLRVRSRTRFVVRWADLARSLDAGLPVVLNCWRAPSGQWSHSVVATEAALAPRRLLTLDPNDGAYRWLTWLRPATGWVCTATFVEPAPAFQGAADAPEDLSAAEGPPPTVQTATEDLPPAMGGAADDLPPTMQGASRIPPEVQGAALHKGGRAGKARL